MKRNHNKNDRNPDPYEDVIRFKKLDPYETLIQSFLSSKQKKESID